jgi:hypothetical protein
MGCLLNNQQRPRKVSHDVIRQHIAQSLGVTGQEGDSVITHGGRRLEVDRQYPAGYPITAQGIGEPEGAPPGRAADLDASRHISPIRRSIFMGSC